MPRTGFRGVSAEILSADSLNAEVPERFASDGFFNQQSEFSIQHFQDESLGSVERTVALLH
jgi:hypothetical protein